MKERAISRCTFKAEGGANDRCALAAVQLAAQITGCDELKAKALRYLANRFHGIAKSKEFVDMFGTPVYEDIIDDLRYLPKS